MRRLFFIFAVIAVLCGGLVLLSYSPLRDITTAPKRGADASRAIQAQDSVIGLPIHLRYADIQAYANEKIPQILVKERKRERYSTRVLGIKVTIKGKLETQVTRTGPVEVGAEGQQLALHVPLSFKARFEGSDLMDPDAKADGKVMVTLLFNVGMNEDWQPVLQASTRYRWLKKPRLKVGVFKLDAREILGDALEKRLKKLSRELEKDVNESAGFKERAAKYWYELHQVRQLGEDDLPAWLMVNPQAAYFQPVRYTEDAMVLEFALATRLTTLLGQVQPPPLAEPLPPLIIGAPEQPGFNLNLPVLIHYEGIRDALAERYLGQSFALEQGKLTIRDVRFYASGDKLVLGAQIDARAPNRLLNTRGWVYLEGRPVIDMDQMQLRVEQLNFTRRVNNPLVSSASWVLQDSLRNQLAQALTLELAEPIEKAKTSFQERINRPIGEGFSLAGNIKDISVDQLQPRDDYLLILLNTRGQVAIHTQVPSDSLRQTQAE